MDPVIAINLLTQILALANTLAPQIEANIAAAKAASSTTDPAVLNAAIVQAHADIAALAARIEALKDPTV